MSAAPATENTATIIIAAPVIRPDVDLTPRAIDSSLSPV